MSNASRMKKRELLWILVISLVAVLLAGCGTSAGNITQAPANTQSAAAKNATSYPFTFTDDSNTQVILKAQPKRIVSFVPSVTESLFALGSEGRVVAVTKYDDYPQGVQKKVEYVFDDGLHPNTEQLLKLNPDLIVLGMHDAKTIAAIRDLKIPTIVINPQNLNATYKTIETLGQITDTVDQAMKIVGAMKEKEQAIEKKVAAIKPESRLRVWTEVDPNLFTPGSGTFLDELITKAGGVNIAQNVKGWAQFSEEQVIAKNPQVIFDTYGYYQKDAKDKIFARASWQKIDAIQNKRVVDLDSDMVTRPGPRIVDGMESIAKALYPDLFK